MNTLLKLQFHYLSLSFSLMLFTAFAFAQDSEPNATPSLLVGQGDQLQRVKAGLAAGNPDLVAALKEIVEEADAALEQPIVNLVDEGAMPPSGDPHDYYSYSTYWWPDPENPDGPYIWRDGVTNPIGIPPTSRRLERCAMQSVHLFLPGISPAMNATPNVQCSNFAPGIWILQRG